MFREWGLYMNIRAIIFSVLMFAGAMSAMEEKKELGFEQKGEYRVLPGREVTYAREVMSEGAYFPGVPIATLQGFIAAQPGKPAVADQDVVHDQSILQEYHVIGRDGLKTIVAFNVDESVFRKSLGQPTLFQKLSIFPPVQYVKGLVAPCGWKMAIAEAICMYALLKGARRIDKYAEPLKSHIIQSYRARKPIPLSTLSKYLGSGVVAEAIGGVVGSLVVIHMLSSFVFIQRINGKITAEELRHFENLFHPQINLPRALHSAGFPKVLPAAMRNEMHCAWWSVRRWLQLMERNYAFVQSDVGMQYAAKLFMPWLTSWNNAALPQELKAMLAQRIGNQGIPLTGNTAVLVTDRLLHWAVDGHQRPFKPLDIRQVQHRKLAKVVSGKPFVSWGEGVTSPSGTGSELTDQFFKPFDSAKHDGRAASLNVIVDSSMTDAELRRVVGKSRAELGLPA